MEIAADDESISDNVEIWLLLRAAAQLMTGQMDIQRDWPEISTNQKVSKRPKSSRTLATNTPVSWQIAETPGPQMMQNTSETEILQLPLLGDDQFGIIQLSNRSVQTKIRIQF